MQVRCAAALLGLLVFGTVACNQRKFESNVAQREVPRKVIKEEPAKPKAPEGPKAPVTETIPNEIEITPLPKEPEPETIEFGSNEIFRIGDGVASTGSNCSGQVNTHKLSGIKYFFQFEVAEDNTEIDLSIGRICGVDQPVKDTFSLINDQSKVLELAEKPLQQGVEIGPAKPWVPYAPFTLKKGIYSVVIASKNTKGKADKVVDSALDEFDDFLVGNIKIKANKSVKALKVYAE